LKLNHSKLKISRYTASQEADFPHIAIKPVPLLFFAVFKPLRPQSNHARTAHLQFIALNEYLRSSLTAHSANFTFHEAFIYPNQPRIVKHADNELAGNRGPQVFNDPL
jgi:hypothetical protein